MFLKPIIGYRQLLKIYNNYSFDYRKQSDKQQIMFKENCSKTNKNDFYLYKYSTLRATI